MQLTSLYTDGKQVLRHFYYFIYIVLINIDIHTQQMNNMSTLLQSSWQLQFKCITWNFKILFQAELESRVWRGHAGTFTVYRNDSWVFLAVCLASLSRWNVSFFLLSWPKRFFSNILRSLHASMNDMPQYWVPRSSTTQWFFHLLGPN